MAYPAALYPVSLVVCGRRCLVVGGGRIAARKVERLLQCGADVTVVAPDVAEDIHLLASTTPTDSMHGSATVRDASGQGSMATRGAVVIEARPYRSPEAAEYRLVIAATGVPEVDRAVFADADAAGVWVNSANDTEQCTFLLPAVHREGTVTVAVSTGGASPALARWLRNELASIVDPDISVLAALLDEARSAMRRSGRSTEALDWLEIIPRRLMPLVRSGDIEAARATVRRIVDGW